VLCAEHERFAQVSGATGKSDFRLNWVTRDNLQNHSGCGPGYTFTHPPANILWKRMLTGLRPYRRSVAIAPVALQPPSPARRWGYTGS
jgi:hypothetical protein